MQINQEQLEKMIADIAGKAIAEKWQEVMAKAQETQRQFTGDIVGGMPASQRVVNAKPKLRHYRYNDIEDQSKEARARKAARCIRYLVGAKGDIDRVASIAKREGDDEIAELYGEYEIWSKALGTQTIAAGGALLPPEFSAGIIELLDAKSVFRKAGPMVMPMNTGSLTMPYINTGATAYYVGQNTNITKSEQTFGQLQLVDHKLACLVPIGNDLLRNGGQVADDSIRKDVVRAMAGKEDTTFLRSDGTAGEPKGLLYWAQSTHKFNANGTCNVANVTADVGKALRLMEQDNVDMDSVHIFMAPRSKWWAKTARDGNNNLVWAPEMNLGSFFGFPFSSTSRIPITTGGSGSEVFFANMDDIVLAENENLLIEVFPGGTYHDGSALVSGISQDQTVIRAISLHDLGARFRGYEISVIEAVNWI